jgi:hypothetical protein
MNKEKIKKIKDFLTHIEFNANEIDISVDVEHDGILLKLAAYRKGKYIGGISQETYNQLLNDKDAKDVLDSLEKIIKGWEEIKIEKILGWATMSEKVDVKDGKIVYKEHEIDEEKVKQLAEKNWHIKQYYMEILKNIEKRRLKKRLEEEYEKLKKEVEESWIRLSLAGNLFNFEGMGTGDNLSKYYTLNIDEERLPDVIKEKIKNYKVYLENTSDTRDADSFLFPHMFKRRKLNKGWYYVVNKEIIDEIRQIAQEMATNEDREIVEKYRNVSKEILNST